MKRFSLLVSQTQPVFGTFSNPVKFLLIIILLMTVPYPQANSQVREEGKFVYTKFSAPSITGNPGLENPVRRLSIYLPPGYDANDKRYPVIYFLHGYGVDDSLMAQWFEFKEIFDRGIAEKRIPPVLVVLPDSKTRYFGSFYTNSSLTGNWGDFIAHDVVRYVDRNYRTIPRPESRGLCGHSMGGNGVLRVVMQYPDIFKAAYALSPGALHWHSDFNLDNRAFRMLGEITDEKAILELDDDPTVDPVQFWIPLLASLGRTFSPEPTAKPHQGRLPVTYIGKKRQIHPEVLAMWEKNFPINMAHQNIEALKSLSGLKIDWGRNDEFPHIPPTCRELSLRLEALGVPHEAEEYIGGHVGRIGGRNGRISLEVLPFFAELLEFSPTN